MPPLLFSLPGSNATRRLTGVIRSYQAASPTQPSGSMLCIPNNRISSATDSVFSVAVKLGPWVSPAATQGGPFDSPGSGQGGAEVSPASADRASTSVKTKAEQSLRKFVI